MLSLSHGKTIERSYDSIAVRSSSDVVQLQQYEQQNNIAAAAAALEHIGFEVQRVVAHQELAREYLPRLFRNDPSLHSLELSNSDCSDIALIALTDSLKVNTHITSLDLGSNSIGNEGAKLLADALRKNQSLITVSLAHNVIAGEGAAALVAALEINDQLCECDMTGNDEIPVNIAKELSILTQLNKKPRALKRTVLDLKRNTAPPTLDLSRAEVSRHKFRELGHDPREHLDDWAAETIAFYLADNITVERVDLAFQHIGDSGAFHLAEMLKRNRKVDKLNLQGNLITVVGAEFLIEALRENISCRFVSLLKNAVSHDVLVRVEWAAVHNRQPLSLKPLLPRIANNDPSVTEVVLDVAASHRYFDDITARLVTDALRCNTVVTRLQITHSHVTEVGCRFLADLIAFHPTLEIVDFSFNPLRSGVEVLATALAANNRIVACSLSGVEMQAEGAQAVADMIKVNVTLHEVDISNNPGIRGCGKVLLASLLHNTVLVDLNVADCGIDHAVLDELAERKRLHSEPVLVRETVSRLYQTPSTCRAVQLSGKRLSSKLHDNSIRIISEALESNITATVIDLSHNSIGLIGFASLILALCENKTTAVDVDLSHNPVGDPDEVTRLVAKLITTHQTLRRLNVSGLGLRDEHLLRLARVFDTDQNFPIQELIVVDDAAAGEESAASAELTDLVTFHLHLLVKLNSLQVRFKEVIRPLWTQCWYCIEERRDIPSAHLDLHRYSPAVDLTVPGEQGRIDEGVKLVCEMLRHVEGFTSLDYSDNFVSDTGAAYVAALLEDSKSRSRLTSVDLSKNCLTDAGLQELKTAAEHSLELRQIRVERNPGVTPGAVEALHRVVLYNTQLPEIQTLLVRVGNDDPTLQTLQFGSKDGPQLEDKQLLLFCEGLQRNTHLTSLDFSHCHITWHGSVSCLMETLIQRMPALQIQRLLLRNLMFSEDDSPALCQALSTYLIENQRLTPAEGGPTSSSTVASSWFNPIRVIDVGCNYIASADLVPLLDAISGHKTLEQFGVANCGLSETEQLRVYHRIPKNKRRAQDDAAAERDVLAIVKANDPAVTQIVSAPNELNEVLAVDVCAAVTEFNQWLTFLDLSSNDLSDGSVAGCFRAMAHNTTVLRLSLRDNKAGAQSCAALMSTLRSNSTLQYIDLQFNPPLIAEVLEELRDNVLKCNDALRSILLSDEEDLFQHAEAKRRIELSRTGGADATAAAHAVAPVNPNDSTSAVSTTTMLSALHQMKVFFAEQLTINQQLVIKHALPRLERNDPEVASLRVHDSAAGPSTLHNDIGLERLSSALLYNTILTELDVSGGLITDRGCVALARALKVNRSLRHVDLSGNEIGDSGVLALCDALQVNPVLEFIDISRSHATITSSSLSRLKTVLLENHELRAIHVLDEDSNNPNNKSSISHSGSRATSARSSAAATSARHSVAGSRVPTADRKRRHVTPEQAAEEARLLHVARQVDTLSSLNNRHLALKSFLCHANETIETTLNLSDAALHGGRTLDSVACRFLCNALAEDAFVETLNLSRNSLDEESGRMISDMLMKNNAITSVDLTDNHIGDSATSLYDALVVNNSVVVLKLGGNACPAITLEKIGLLLQLNREHLGFKREILQILRKQESHTVCRVHGAPPLSDSSSGMDRDVRVLPGFANRKFQLDDESCDILCGVLKADLIVRTIDVSWNAVTDSGFHSLLLLCKRNKGIQSLTLAHNLLTDEAVARLTEALPLIPSLTEVDLGYNTLTFEVAPALTNLMRRFPSLQVVRAQGNRIAPKELDVLEFFSRVNRSCSDALRAILVTMFDNAPALAHVDMNSFYSYGNWAADGSTMQLLTFSLLSNTCVTSLELEFNDIDDRQFRMLCNMLRTNKTLRSVNLANNLVEDIAPLCDGEAFGLEKLFLRKNKLPLAAAMALAKMLARNETRLVELDVSHNLWGRAGGSVLKDALPMNTSLRVLELEGPGIPSDVVDRAHYALTLDYRRVVLSEVDDEEEK